MGAAAIDATKMGDIMLDLYSKIVLSVIAGALVVIAWNGLGDSPAHAVFGEACGSIGDPCYITTTETLTVEILHSIGTVPVDVQNWPR